MVELRKGSARYAALVAFLMAIVVSVALCVTNMRVALADEGTPDAGANAAQVVETAEEMGPWLYGAPLVAQAE